VFVAIGESFCLCINVIRAPLLQAKPMMKEVFTTSLPAVVTASFASSYLLLLSAANLGGA